MLAAGGAAIRFAVALQVRKPVYYPDEFVHAFLARSFADGNPGQIRGGSVHFVSYLAPLLMSPAWLIRDVGVAYRVAQGLGSVAFAAAAFPAYFLARRLGISTHGSLVVVLLTLAVPDGMFASGLLAEPYAYPLFLLAVLVAWDAIADPTVARQLLVVGSAGVLVLVGGTELAPFGLAYLAASFAAAPSSPWSYVKREAVFVGAAAIGAAVVAVAAVLGSGLISDQVATASHGFRYPPVATVEWFGFNAFALALASGWVVVPGVALGLWRLAGHADRRCRAFGFLSLFLILGQLIGATPWGPNGGAIIERYTFYGAPLLFLACVWAAESMSFKRTVYALLAYLMAIAAILVPLSRAFRGAGIAQSPSLLALLQLEIGDVSSTAVWAPILTVSAIATGLWRGARGRTIAYVALGFCCLTSLASSHAIVELSRATSVTDVRGHVPSQAALLTSATGTPELEQTLFWNRGITRVVVIGGGAAPDMWAYIPGQLDPQGAIVTAGGARLDGPFVVGENTLLIDRAGGPHEGGVVTLHGRPAVLAFGWYTRLGYLATVARIFAVARHQPFQIAIHLRSFHGEKTIAFRCTHGLRRDVRVGGAWTPVRIPVPRGAVQECRVSLVRGGLESVAGHDVTVRATLALEPVRRQRTTARRRR